MPRPVYIICAESGSEDKDTQLLSLFNIVERIEVTPLPQGEGPFLVLTTALRVAAVWMRGEGETAEDEFEHQMVISPPANAEPVSTEVTPFRFEKLLRRFSLKTVVPLG